MFLNLWLPTGSRSTARHDIRSQRQGAAATLGRETADGQWCTGQKTCLGPAACRPDPSVMPNTSMSLVMTLTSASTCPQDSTRVTAGRACTRTLHGVHHTPTALCTGMAQARNRQTDGESFAVTGTGSCSCCTATRQPSHAGVRCHACQYQPLRASDLTEIPGASDITQMSDQESGSNCRGPAIQMCGALACVKAGRLSCINSCALAIVLAAGAVVPGVRVRK